ncbi:MAG: hypothetical protein A2172_00105 [Candidatus Woykebacteria bacterium RBG_13_40_15]|uniref:Uncharacterized protein n=1 Tax=Candidatus Woykebacteria bacterium RBG_13_40_15 TaxID=1802593 RepID=A0A1G1W7X9_9BACT|nr:MAG: hypothetical protein A2172_00105 [Candidatus Woykebacteria bacterium RBG_13_40_15]
MRQKLLTALLSLIIIAAIVFAWLTYTGKYTYSVDENTHDFLVFLIPLPLLLFTLFLFFKANRNSGFRKLFLLVVSEALTIFVGLLVYIFGYATICFDVCQPPPLFVKNLAFITLFIIVLDALIIPAYPIFEHFRSKRTQT